MSYECFDCQDRGFYYSKEKGSYIKCRCQVRKQLQLFLGEYKDFKILKKSISKIDSYKKDLLIKNCDRNTFGNLIKTILTTSYLDNPEVTFQSISGNDITDGLFNTDDYGNKAYMDYYIADILILKLGRDNSNKALPDLMANLLTYRKEHNLITIVYVYKEAKESRLIQHYGEVAMKIIEDYKSVVFK